MDIDTEWKRAGLRVIKTAYGNRPVKLVLEHDMYNIYLGMTDQERADYIMGKVTPAEIIITRREPELGSLDLIIG